MSPFPFSNIEFFALLMPALALVLLAKWLGEAAFIWTLIAASLGFFVWLPGLHLEYALLCASLIAITWAAGTARLRGGVALAVPAAIVTLLVAFVMVRIDAAGMLTAQDGVTRTSRLLPIFGFAFLVIKAYGLLIDVSAGRIKQMRVADVLAYFLFFPTLIAGPVFRFTDFETQLRQASAERADWRRIGERIPRLLWGALKVMVLAALLEPYSIQSLPADVIAGDVRRVYLGMLTYYFFEYVNFSGYTDMAIAVSGMIGLRAPENFDLPFLARSLTELWRRWHMTFAAWLRDYVYFPLNFQIASRASASSKRGRMLSSALAIFVTFVLCGFWHGLQAGTLLFGALSGTVLAIETLANGVSWAEGPAFLRTAAGRVGLDTAKQVWTLHVAAVTFAPVLLDSAQLAALGRLIARVA